MIWRPPQRWLSENTYSNENIPFKLYHPFCRATVDRRYYFFLICFLRVSIQDSTSDRVVSHRAYALKYLCAKSDIVFFVACLLSSIVSNRFLKTIYSTSATFVSWFSIFLHFFSSYFSGWHSCTTTLSTKSLIQASIYPVQLEALYRFSTLPND